MPSTISLIIEGMSCAACVRRVEKSMQKLVGVSDATVNLGTGAATITVDLEQSPLTELLTAVEVAGCSVQQSALTLAVSGMSCASCVGRVEKSLRKLPGLISASVNLATSKATLCYIPQLLSSAQIFRQLHDAGYPATPLDAQNDNTAKPESEALKKELLLAASLTLPLFIISMGKMVPLIGPAMANLMTPQQWVWIEWLLATPVLFFAGRRFFRIGFTELKHFNPGMNSLVMIGASAAYGYSLLSLLAPQLFPEETANSYFEAAGVIVTLILLGRFLEDKAKGRTSQAISKLMQLQAKTARIKKGDSTEQIDIDLVIEGDTLLVKPGERLPVDGEVIEGESYVDESLVSGEPAPVKKRTGDAVTGGTINQNGSLTYRATHVGDESFLSQIIRVVEQAQSDKPPIQALADKIAGVFVPVVIVIALITFACWWAIGPDPALSYAFVTSVSVLLIACPCAMGLATPAAIMVSTGRGAELGILFRKGAAIESLAKIDTVVLDKTGTLTMGRMALADFTLFDANEAALLSAVASLETLSEHPLAQAIVNAAEQRGLALQPVDQFKTEPGYGVCGSLDGKHYRVGNARYMKLALVDIDLASSTVSRYTAQAQTPIYVAEEGRFVAVLSIADQLRSESANTIKTLINKGIEVHMLTGDNSHTAKAIARELGITHVMAEVLPQEKSQHIKALQAAGQRVAFVGDGINDAPALAQADVGIAIGEGTDIAIESGDVVLIRNSLKSIPQAIKLAKKTQRTIMMNFGWAYGYNLLLIPIAAGVMYPVTGWLLNPMLAAGAMSISSVLILTNSLRIKRAG